MPRDSASRETSSSGQAAAEAEEPHHASFQPRHPPRISRGPVILLVIGAALELLSRLVPNTVGPRELMEQATSLVAFSFMSGSALWVIRQLGDIPRATRLVTAAACLVMVSQTLIVSDQIPRLDSVPVLGRQGFFHEPLENLPFPVGVLLLLAGFLYAALDAHRARHRLALEHEEVRKEFAERKRADAALRQSEEQYRHLFEQLNDAAFLADADTGIILDANRQAEVLLGRTRDEIIGMHQSELHPPDKEKEYRRTFADHVARGRAADYGGEIVRKDGSTVQVMVSAAVLTLGGKRLIAGLFRDITELKDMEEALRKSRDDLEERIKERTVELQRANEELVAEITERKRVEEALRESEERYRTLVETSPDAITLADLNGNIIVTNDRGARLMGFDNVHEVIASGKTVYDFIAPEDRERALESTRKTLETGSVRNIEYRLLRNDGSSFPGEISASVVPDADGKPTAFIGVMRDITERKIARDALRESEERYRTLVETSPDAIALCDLNGNVIVANRQAARLAGFETVDELIASRKTVLDLIAPEERQRAMDNARKILETGSTSSGEYTVLRKDGSPFPGEIAASAVVDADGKPKGFIGIVREISERREAEKALQESEEKYRHIVEGSIDAVGMAQEGKVIYVNDAFCKMFGYERDELIGQSILKVVAPEYRSRVEERNKRRLQGQEVPNRYVFTGMKKDGERLFIGFSSSGRFMYRGKPTVLAILRDITEQRRAQERVRASLKEKEVLLKEIQHRVKNNLQVISSLFDLQSRYTSDDHALEMLKESRNRLKSIALIHEKLYQTQDVTKIDFAEYIRSLTAHLFRSYGVSASSVRLMVNVDDVSLSVDKAIPCALIVNELVSNSLKHAFQENQQGEIRIELCSDDSNVALIVGDNGIGLPAHLDFRNAASLGLRLVKTLANQLRATVDLDRDGGTRFKITFAQSY